MKNQHVERSQTAPILPRVKQSVSLKLIIIALLSVILLVPATMIMSIIEEREQLNKQAITEVSYKWAKRQIINGPIVSVPIEYETIQDEKVLLVRDYWHLLPEDLEVNGKINSKKLNRGIYEIVVYASNLSLKGSFKLEGNIEQPRLTKIHWDEAFITLGISDLRGISEEVFFNFNNERLDIQPGSRIKDLIYAGFTVDLPSLEGLENTTIPFNLDIQLQGSENLSFIPVGKNTKVFLSSDWSSPSFMGNFLPKDRKVTENGFEASWQVLQLNRNFPQHWVGNSFGSTMNGSTFGLDLMLPLDDYQKSMRSAKYAIMTIGLTFMVFFLTEIFQRRKIHPIQYTIVGLALCLFYILLVSLSEHIDFDVAYFIAAFAVILMVSLYSINVFKVKRYSFILVAVLTGIYSFLFVILQMSDYALLMGSIGLSAILGATMYFTRNIDWYSIGESKQNNIDSTIEGNESLQGQIE